MTEAMPFLRNTILLSYDTRSLAAGDFFIEESFLLGVETPLLYGGPPSTISNTKTSKRCIMKKA